MGLAPFLNKTVTRKRYAAGSFVSGVYQKGSETTSALSMSVQPLSPNEIRLLEEGYRTAQTLKVYTDEELRTANEALGISPDILTIDSVDYEVHRVDRWRRPGSSLEHYKAIVIKVDDQGGTIT